VSLKPGRLALSKGWHSNETAIYVNFTELFEYVITESIEVYPNKTVTH